VVIHKDDYQPCGGEKRAGLRPPPALSFQGCSSSTLGRRASRVGVRLPRGLVVCFFLQHSGEKGIRQPCEGGKLRLRGVGRLRRRQLPRAWLLGLGGFGATSGAAPAAWTGRGCPSTARATVAPCAGRPHPRLLPHRRPHRGDVQDVLRRGSGGGVLGWSCPHSRSEDGSEDLFARAGAAAIRRYGTGAQVAAVVGAEVVTATGEAPHCRCGCLRWRDHQCHLPPGPRLFGFNGLVAAPRRKTGARTFSQWRTCRSGRHCWRVVGAEAAVAVSADVVASAGEPLGASYPVALPVWR
jgi:hypothetical protein